MSSWWSVASRSFAQRTSNMSRVTPSLPKKIAHARLQHACSRALSRPHIDVAGVGRAAAEGEAGTAGTADQKAHAFAELVGVVVAIGVLRLAAHDAEQSIRRRRVGRTPVPEANHGRLVEPL